MKMRMRMRMTRRLMGWIQLRVRVFGCSAKAQQQKSLPIGLCRFWWSNSRTHARTKKQAQAQAL